MIRRLRVAHRVTFMSLAAVLPIGVALAVLVRPEGRDRMFSGQSKLIEQMENRRPPRQEFTKFQIPANNTLPFEVEMAFASETHARDWIEFWPREDPRIADLLIYASLAEDREENGAGLPDKALLVASLNSTERIVAPWPEGATELIVYSLAKSRRIGSVQITEDSDAEVQD